MMRRPVFIIVKCLPNFKGELRESVAYVRQMREFLEFLDQPSLPTAWTYMEDEFQFILIYSILRGN